MKKVYLIRHALPDFPGGKSMCIGMTDIPLGEQGFSQSAKMAAGQYRQHRPLECPLPFWAVCGKCMQENGTG